MSESLTEFLLARIAEDEAAARAAFWPEAAAEYNPAREDDGRWSTGEHEMYASRVEGNGITIYDEGGHTAAQARHIARHDPARVLAECEVKRRIVELHRPSTDHGARFKPYCEGCWEAGGEGGAPLHPCATVRILATPYADHPDYREEWRL